MAELRQRTRERYQKANKKNKGVILDQFVADTGYHRKYAMRILGRRPRPRKQSQPRKPHRTYTAEVRTNLIHIWEVCDRIASRRLHPFLPEMVAVLERTGDLHLAPATKDLLLSMSRATMDRLLKEVRAGPPRRGLSTTKPGTLLKHMIPIRTFAEWDDARPGFLEIDLVAHCGDTTEGEYLATLNAVDIVTGWSECIVPANRGQHAVWAALHELRQRLPVPLLGIDSDNDSAFVNAHLLRYCRRRRSHSPAVVRTRSTIRRMWSRRTGLWCAG